MSRKPVANRVWKEVENRQVCGRVRGRGHGGLVPVCLKFKCAPAIDEGGWDGDEWKDEECVFICLSNGHLLRMDEINVPAPFLILDWRRDECRGWTRWGGWGGPDQGFISPLKRRVGYVGGVMKWSDWDNVLV